MNRAQELGVEMMVINDASFRKCMCVMLYIYAGLFRTRFRARVTYFNDRWGQPYE